MSSAMRRRFGPQSSCLMARSSALRSTPLFPASDQSRALKHPEMPWSTWRPCSAADRHAWFAKRCSGSDAIAVSNRLHRGAVHFGCCVVLEIAGSRGVDNRRIVVNEMTQEEYAARIDG